MLAQELAALFARDLTRLEQELRAFLDTGALWVVAPGATNAAGTLALIQDERKSHSGYPLRRRECPARQVGDRPSDH